MCRSNFIAVPFAVETRYCSSGYNRGRRREQSCRANTRWRSGSAAVDAVRPEPLVERALSERATRSARAPRVLVVGAGKAGPGMAAGLEAALADRLDRVEGLVNVPAGMTAPLEARSAARGPAAGRQRADRGGRRRRGGDAPAARVAPGRTTSRCACSPAAGRRCCPAPAEGVTLADKQAVTKLLHRCGATIDEMNCVRKHLSRGEGRPAGGGVPRQAAACRSSSPTWSATRST